MGLFGVKRYDDEYDNGGKSRHYFSVLSPQDLSESNNLELPFEDDELVDGGSCGDAVLYFYGTKGKTVIFNLQNHETIEVPPPEWLSNLERSGPSGLGYDPKSGEYIALDCGRRGVSYDANYSGDEESIPIDDGWYNSCGVSYDANYSGDEVLIPIDDGWYNGCGVSYDANYSGDEVLIPINDGWYNSCGVSYDAKSGEYKVIRIFSIILRNVTDVPGIKYYIDLYYVLSATVKYIREPAWGLSLRSGASIYVGEAGSGSGSCYWANHGNHVLSFNFATEKFDHFPLPAVERWHEIILVRCRGSVGVVCLLDSN